MNHLLIATLASSLLLAGSNAGAQSARARIADAPIRAEPNPASAIIATLKAGGPVDVVDLQGDWYKVMLPGDPGKPRVGYVLARLIEIVNADGSAESLTASPASGAARPVAQGPPIPPTLSQLQPRRDKAAEREQALKAEVDALQAELTAVRNGQPIGQIRAGQIPPPVAQHPRAREGFWVTGGFGFGSLSCETCDRRWSGSSGGLSLGGTINERFLLGVGTTGWIGRSRTLSAGTLDARLRLYPIPTSGFFLTGGMGLGRIADPSKAEYGLGVVLGLGWDVPVRSNVNLTPFYNGFGISTANLSAGVGQFGLGITIH